jgi:hypothetical protein
MNNPLIEKELARFTRTPDFELYVGHANAPSRNYYQEWARGG